MEEGWREDGEKVDLILGRDHRCAAPWQHQSGIVRQKTGVIIPQVKISLILKTFPIIRITFAMQTGLSNKIQSGFMKAIKNFILILLLILPFLAKAEIKEIPFTLDDRDRIIRTEQKVEALDAKINSKVAALDAKIDSKVDGLRSEMNSRFESIDARFNQLFNFLWAIIGIFTAMMVSVFGFAFWDRKLSLAPMKIENAKTLQALRDFAEHQPRLREILKNAGLL